MHVIPLPKQKNYILVKTSTETIRYREQDTGGVSMPKTTKWLVYTGIKHREVSLVQDCTYFWNGPRPRLPTTRKSGLTRLTSWHITSVGSPFLIQASHRTYKFNNLHVSKAILWILWDYDTSEGHQDQLKSKWDFGPLKRVFYPNLMTFINEKLKKVKSISLVTFPHVSEIIRGSIYAVHVIKTYGSQFMINTINISLAYETSYIKS